MKVSDLLEDNRRFPRSGVNLDNLDADEIQKCAKWIIDNASEYFSVPEPIAIWRGMVSNTEGIYDTNQIHRFSKGSGYEGDTYNYYTLWIDNAPQWSEYPKRSKSMICSTSYKDTTHFGGAVYRIIPSDSCKIGIVPAHDMWFAFKPAVKYLRSLGLDKIAFIDSLKNLARMFDIFLNKGRSDEDEFEFADLETDWSKFKEALQELTPDLILDTVRENTFKWKREELRAYTVLVKELQRKGYDSLYEMLEEILSPNRNHFILASPSNIPDDIGKELWIGNGEVLAIKPHNMPFVMKAVERLKSGARNQERNPDNR